MSVRRRAAKRDGNERAIIDGLRAVGALVYPLSERGYPDLLVAYRDNTYLLEVKARKGKLEDAQIEFRDNWTGGVLALVRTLDEALEAIGAVEA